MYHLRYALYDFSAPRGLSRGYFGGIAAYAPQRIAEPGHVMPVCVLVGAVLRLLPVLWARAGITLNTCRRSATTHLPLTGEAILRSRTYGPLYHRRQRCIVPASGYYTRGRTDAPGSAAYARSPDGGLLGFAGLWTPDAARGTSSTLSYTLVCRLAEHDPPAAAPIILMPEKFDAWLNAEDPRHLLSHRAEPLLAIETVVNEPWAAAPRLKALDTFTRVQRASR